MPIAFAKMPPARSSLASFLTTLAHDHEALFWICTFTLVGCVVNFVVPRLPGASTKPVGGSPAWMTHVSIGCQLAYSVLMVFGAWNAATGGAYSQEWWAGDAGGRSCAAPSPMLDAADPGTWWWERIFLFALCGYMVKDLFQPMSPLIVAHHVFCLTMFKRIHVQLAKENNKQGVAHNRLKQQNHSGVWP